MFLTYIFDAGHVNAINLATLFKKIKPGVHHEGTLIINIYQLFIIILWLTPI